MEVLKMKLFKYFFIILITFVVSIYKVAQVEALSVEHEATSYYFSMWNKEHTKRLSDKFELFSIDGVVSYCIEPGVSVGNNLVLSDLESTKIDKDVMERISLIAYYGYTYPGHATFEYRVATQTMIWDTILNNGDDVVVSSWVFGGGTILDVSYEKAEIERLISIYNIKPSFHGLEYSVQAGSTLKITDENGVLSQYLAMSDGSYYVNGNDIFIETQNSSEFIINFKKLGVYDEHFKIFAGSNQNMVIAGNADDVNASVVVKPYYSILEIYKKDSEKLESTSSGQGKLEGARYGVYDASTDTLVAELITDENGYAISDAILEYKTYYVKEIESSIGYYIDNNIYYVDMRNRDKYTLEVLESPIKNHINILKQYAYVDGDSTLLSAEENIYFDILYPDGEKLDTIKTDNNGYASIDLPYGNWIFRQVNVKPGYSKVYDFEVVIDAKSDLIQQYNVLNNKLAAYLEVVKKDAETGEIIKLSGTTFKIINLDTNKYVSQYVSGKYYDEFKTSSDGKLMTYLKLDAGNYKLIETYSPIGYLIDMEGLNFSIDDTVDYIYTQNGAIMSLEYENKPIKGIIKIYKTKEVFKTFNDSFYYDEEAFENVILEIYAENDITSPDGKHIYYKKDELVDRVVTDKNGIAFSKELPLGKYFIKEVNGDSNYYVDTIYEVKLESGSNTAAIVYSEISILNQFKKSSFVLTKIDAITRETLPQALFYIYDTNDNLIYKGETADSGVLRIDNLPIGVYKYCEVIPPVGYSSNSTVYYFKIRDNEVVSVTYENEPVMKIDVPNTYKSESKSTVNLGYISFIGGTILIIYGKYKKEGK